MAKKSSSGGGGNHRSAKTGRFVTKKYADKNPNTTVREAKKPTGSNPGKKGK